MNPTSKLYKLKYELTPNYHKVKGRLVPLIWNKRNLRQPKSWLDRVNAMVISTMLALIPVSTLTLKIPEVPQHTTSDGIINYDRGITQSAELHISPPKKQVKLKPVYIAPKPKPRPAVVLRTPTHTAGIPAVLLRIRHCESTDNYTAQNAVSTASGAYQFVDGTWAGYGGYSKAKYAPAAVQDAKALMIYNSSGTTPWVSSVGCWG